MSKIALISLVAPLLMFAEGTSKSEAFQIISLEKAVPLPQEEVAPSEQLAHQEINSFFQQEEAPADFAMPQPAREEMKESAALPSAVLPDLSSKGEVAILDEPQIVANPRAFDLVEKSLQSPPPAEREADVAFENRDLVTDAEIAELEKEIDGGTPKLPGIMIDIGQVFSGSPTIYSILVLLSIGSFCIWLYSFLSLRSSNLLPAEEIKVVREKLLSKEYDEAASLCKMNDSILFRMLGSALSSRAHGHNVMQEMMKAEGRRSSAGLWQKISFLNDVAMIAPMLGLLGTVLGMFYAFYDLNRSMESISALFDGLGVSVGTTVAGLVVAILAMIFHSVMKYRLVKQLNLIENEAVSLAHLITPPSHQP